MTTNTATVTQPPAQVSRNGFHLQRTPLWLGALVALIGATIATLAVKADWMFLGDAYQFAFRQTHIAMTCGGLALLRSEEHTSELQSRFGIPYAVFCLK